MESNSLSSFFRILRESLLLFLESNRLMVSTALFILLYHSYIVFCNFFSVKSLMELFIMKQTELLSASPGSSQYINIVAAMASYFHECAGFEWFFILVLSITSLFLSATTILASAVTYAEGNSSFRDLQSRVFKSWTRPIVTWFYISLFDLGYVFLVFSLIFPFSVNFSSLSFRSTTFVYILLIPVSAFQMYLSVFWKMSLVISVLEEKSGLEAFGEASQILKGFKLQGFLLNLVYGAPVLVLNIWGYMKISVNLGAHNPLLMGLILSNVGCLSKMLLDMAFTVLYHKCKLRNEQNVELHGSLERCPMNQRMGLTYHKEERYCCNFFMFLIMYFLILTFLFMYS